MTDLQRSVFSMDYLARGSVRTILRAEPFTSSFLLACAMSSFSLHFWQLIALFGGDDDDDDTAVDLDAGDDLDLFDEEDDFSEEGDNNLNDVGDDDDDDF